MEGWSGFTDEELRKLKQTSTKQPSASERRTTATRGRITGRAGIRPSGPIQGRPPEKPPALSSDMMLSQPKPRPEGPKLSPAMPQVPSQIVQEVGYVKTELTSEVKEVDIKEVSQTDFVQKQLTKVESYQLQQKVMEEQNKVKKKLLSQAIAEKQKKAKAEASKLVHIQKELGTLDQMLSSDVAIIRDRIEEASREFLEAQKRYERAEKEYVEAKLALHHTNELKEQLTEHLYTIIHQNELRKAKKLTELMEKLELAEESIPEVQVELTSLMPNILPEMSTISTFDMLNSKVIKQIHSENDSLQGTPSAGQTGSSSDNDKNKGNKQNCDDDTAILSTHNKNATPQETENESPTNKSLTLETNGANTTDRTSTQTESNNILQGSKCDTTHENIDKNDNFEKSELSKNSHSQASRQSPVVMNT